MKILVTHGNYGCDTGCCGHWLQVDGVNRAFEFMHPNGDLLEWAQDFVRTKLGEEHVKDLDWEHCLISED